MAEKIVDLIVAQINQEFNKKFGKSITKHLPISGGDMSGSRFFENFVQKRIIMGKQLGLSEDQSRYLAKFYGTNVDKVFDYIAHATGDLPKIVYGQLYYAMNDESASTATDFFIRRTSALLFNIQFVEQFKESVIDEMAHYLKWSDQEKQRQIEWLDKALNDVKIV